MPILTRLFKGPPVRGLQIRGRFVFADHVFLWSGPYTSDLLKSWLNRCRVSKSETHPTLKQMLVPLVSLPHREKVEGYIQLAQEEGGTIACGGVRPVLDGVNAEGAFF